MTPSRRPARPKRAVWAAAADRPLNLREARFAAEYVIDLNGEKAAIRAGYSQRTAIVQASQLLTRLNVKAELTRLLGERARRTEITADRVLTEYAKLAFANMGDYMGARPDGDPYLNFSGLSRDQQAALAEVTVDTYVDGGGEFTREVKRVRFKLADKLGALNSVAKHLGMFTERHELTGKDGGPIAISRIELVPISPRQAALEGPVEAGMRGSAAPEDD